MMIGMIALAIAMTLAGAALIHAGWSGRVDNRPPAVCSGWALTAAAALPWIAATGVEFGIALALLVPSCAAWVFVAVSSRQMARGGRRPDNGGHGVAAELPLAGFSLPTLSTLVHHLWLFLLAVPFAGVASTLVSIAVSELLPWSDMNRWALTVVLMPTLWALAAAWQVSAERWQVPAGTLLISALLCAAVLM